MGAGAPQPTSPSSVAGRSTDGTDSESGESEAVAARIAQSVLAEAKRAIGASDAAQRSSVGDRSARSSRL